MNLVALRWTFSICAMYFISYGDHSSLPYSKSGSTKVQYSNFQVFESLRFPNICFNTMFQHEVFGIISTLNAGSLCLRHVNHGNTNHDCFFWTKGHKIVEILALLTTKLSSSTMYKVGMLFSIQWTLF